MSEQPRLLVWSQGEVWRWTYEEPSQNGSGPFRLDSSTAFPDAGEARSAAEVAYPGVDIETAPADVPERGGPDRGVPEPGHRHDVAVDMVLAAIVGVAVFVAHDGGRLVLAWFRWIRGDGRGEIRPVVRREIRREVRREVRRQMHGVVQR